MELLYVLLGFVFGSVLTWLVANLYQKSAWVSKKSYDKTVQQWQTTQQELTKIAERAKAWQEKSEEQKRENRQLADNVLVLSQKLTKSEAQLDAEREKLENQKAEMGQLHQQFQLEFQQVAQKLLEEKSERFTKQNQQNISNLLKPLGEQLNQFKEKVEATYDRESKQRFSLEKEIGKLFALNQQVSQEANNLAKALKGDSKTQGNWGEMILENILERSGLQKDREYFLQESFSDQSGSRKQPDVVVKFPNERWVVIDSKVSLTAYERLANAENDTAREVALAEHLRSMKRHIEQLSGKSYEERNETLDFVVMFVPIEPAYLTAVQHDTQLWNYAYQKRIVMVSPTNLIAILKMIADLWVREKRNLNAQEIADRAEKMYDKFVLFAQDMENVGKHLESAQKSWKGAFNRLSKGKSNVIRQLEQLKELGVNPKKTLPDSLQEPD